MRVPRADLAAPSPRVRKDLCADALFRTLKTEFERVPEWRKGDIDYAMGDTLMAGFTMFSLKDPSLLAVERRLQCGALLRLWGRWCTSAFPPKPRRVTILRTYVFSGSRPFWAAVRRPQLTAVVAPPCGCAFGT